MLLWVIFPIMVMQLTGSSAVWATRSRLKMCSSLQRDATASLALEAHLREYRLARRSVYDRDRSPDRDRGSLGVARRLSRTASNIDGTKKRTPRPNIHELRRPPARTISPFERRTFETDRLHILRFTRGSLEPHCIRRLKRQNP